MLSKRVALMSFSLLILLPILFAGHSEGASYPARPLEIVAPANPGGGWDALARTMTRVLEIEKLYPQPMAVLNKPGGGGAVGLAYIFQKKGDDYEMVASPRP